MGLGKLFFDRIKADFRKDGVECIISTNYFYAAKSVKGFFDRLGFKEMEDNTAKLFL